MANPGYVRSTDGSNTDDGSTWALANATLVGAIADAVAGNKIFVSHVHAETQGSAMTITLPGTLASPVQVVCVNDAAEPPTTVATTATITTTGAFAMTINGSGYIDGIHFHCGTGAAAANLAIGGGNGQSQTFANGSLNLNTTNAGSRISLGSTGGRQVFNNMGVKFGHVSQFIQPQVSYFEWNGGSILAGSAAVTNLFQPDSTFGRIQAFQISGVDFSNGATGLNLFNNAGGGIRGVVRNCKLPTGWSGSLFTGSATQRTDRVEMHNCSAGAVNYSIWVESYVGSIRDETTLVRTGGASDGTTPICWKMSAFANAEYPLLRLVSPEVAIWNETTGSAKTGTVSFIHSGSAPLQNDEISLDVEYLGSSASPISSFVDDAPATVLTTATDQDADTGSAWDSLVTARANSTLYAIGNLIKVASNPGRVFICTVGGTTGGSEAAGFATAADGDSVTDGGTFKAMYRQKMNVTFTPQMKGVILWSVKFSNKFATAATKLAYVDSKMILS
jgi:hypothetical protein